MLVHRRCSQSSARDSTFSPPFRSSRWLVLLLLTAASGCFTPHYTDGALQCAADKLCPDGYHCAVDNTCWQLGKDPPPQHSVNIAVSAGGVVGDPGDAAHRVTTCFGQPAGITHSTTEHSIQVGVLASTVGN
jgi:hypothetical protein